MRTWRVVFALVFVFLTACAQTPKKFEYHESASSAVFPPPPDEPRFRFVGYLSGETNFTIDKEQQHWLKKSLAWIVGLTIGDRQPITLSRPQSGVIDEVSNKVYVTDSSAHAVFAFNRGDGQFSVFESAAEFVNFKTPVGIGLIGQDIIIADADLGALVRLSPQGDPVNVIGETVLERPTGLCVNTKRKRVYVTDTRRHKVVVFDYDGAQVGEFGQYGNGPAEFNAPTHLACSDDALFVSDTLNARVQVLTSDGEFKFEFAKRSLYMGDLPRPKGIAVDKAGRIYVVESYYDYLLVYDEFGRPLLPIDGTGGASGKFELPAGAWTDSAGGVYVADMLNGRVAVFTYTGDDDVGVKQPATQEINAVSGNESHNKPN